MAACLHGLKGVARNLPLLLSCELFGWLANAESLESMAARAAVGGLPRPRLCPTQQQLHHVKQDAQLSGSSHHLAGWLRYGALQACADALSIYGDLRVASWGPNGFVLQAEVSATANRFARGFAVRRVVKLWDGVVPRPLHFGEVAISATLKLLTKCREMPVLEGQHVCCFCGCHHFYTAVQTTVMHGCFRVILKDLSDFKLPAAAPPDEWHSLLMRTSCCQALGKTKQSS
eukprot:420875-Amphidinium_carterae.4